MLQININTQPIRLDYNTQNARLNLQSTQVKVQTELVPATLEIRQPRGELTVDSTPCRYSMGLKNIADFARDNAALGRQSAMGAIARIVDEGNQMAQIEYRSNAIVNIASNSNISQAPEVVLGHIASPNVQYQVNRPQIDVTVGKVNTTVQPGSVQGDYQPGRVDIRVTQYPSIEISTVDVKV